MLTEAGDRNSELQDKHCVHQLGTWFHDQRQPSPDRQPPRSRRTIFEEILYNSDLSYKQKKLLASSFVNSEDDGPSDEEDEGFPFEVDPTLPHEFKKLIWRRAWIPRVIDVRSSSRKLQRERSDPSSTINPRSFSSRMAQEKLIKWYESDLFRELLGTKDIQHLNTTFGFITSQDTIFFGHDYWKCLPQSDVDAEITTIPKSLNSQAIAVHWDRFLSADVAWNHDNTRSYWNLDFLDRWSFIKDLKALKTLHISWIGANPRSSHGRDSRAITYRVGPEAAVETNTSSSAIPVLVDLYDSARLAEMMALDTSVHFKTPHWRHWPTSTGRPRMCINCEREAWMTDYYHNVERLWILLHIMELESEAERRNVLRPNTPLDRKHGWVLEKLSLMPDIRPAVLFDLHPRLESQNDIYCEWEEE